MNAKNSKKSIDNIGTLLAVVVFIALVVSSTTHRYDLLLFFVGIAVGYMIVVHYLQKTDYSQTKSIETVHLFFSYALQNVDFDDNAAILLSTITHNINHVVQSEHFIGTNKNSIFNPHKLEIAIYKEIIKEIQKYSSGLQIAPLLLEKAHNYLKRLENKEV